MFYFCFAPLHSVSEDFYQPIQFSLAAAGLDLLEGDIELGEVGAVVAKLLLICFN